MTTPTKPPTGERWYSAAEKRATKFGMNFLDDEARIARVEKQLHEQRGASVDDITRICHLAPRTVRRILGLPDVKPIEEKRPAPNAADVPERVQREIVGVWVRGGGETTRDQELAELERIFALDRATILAVLDANGYSVARILDETDRDPAPQRWNIDPTKWSKS